MEHKTLLQARTDRGWTQQRLAELSGIAQARISQIESGITRNPSNKTVRVLEQALELERGTLVFGEEAVAS